MDRAAQFKIGIALGVLMIVLAIGQLFFTDKPASEAMFYMLLGAGFIAVFYFLLERCST